jgi:hypothetical protein
MKTASKQSRRQSYQTLFVTVGIYAEPGEEEMETSERLWELKNGKRSERGKWYYIAFY